MLFMISLYNFIAGGYVGLCFTNMNKLPKILQYVPACAHFLIGYIQVHFQETMQTVFQKVFRIVFSVNWHINQTAITKSQQVEWFGFFSTKHYRVGQCRANRIVLLLTLFEARFLYVFSLQTPRVLPSFTWYQGSILYTYFYGGKK